MIEKIECEGMGGFVEGESCIIIDSVLKGVDKTCDDAKGIVREISLSKEESMEKLGIFKRFREENGRIKVCKFPLKETLKVDIFSGGFRRGTLNSQARNRKVTRDEFNFFLSEKRKQEVLKFLEEFEVKRIRYGDKDKAKFEQVRKFKKFINDHSFQPITSEYERYLSELFSYRGESPLWWYLSKDKSSGKHFDKQKQDPSEPIIFVDISFLKRRKGNVPDASYKIERVNEQFKTGKFQETPNYSLGYDEVGEGNHRVDKLYREGYSSAPMDLSWGY